MPTNKLRFNSNNLSLSPQISQRAVQSQFTLLYKLLNTPKFLTNVISVSPTQLPYRRMEGNDHFKNETSPKLHHIVPSKIKPIHVLLMHTPLTQKADTVPTPDPTLTPNYPVPCGHWLAYLVDLLRNATFFFLRTFLWFMLSLQHRLSSDKFNHLSEREGLWVSEHK